MAKRSLTDAAFEGFRLTRENIGPVAVWSLLILIASGSVTAAMLHSGALPLMEQAAAAKPPDQVMMQKALAALMPAILAVAPISLVATALFQTAVCRAILKSEEGRFFFLGLGLAEARTLLIRVLIGLIYGGLVFVALLLIGVAGPIGLLALLAVLVVIAALSVRFSLAIPAAFVEGGLGLSRSWALSKGRFWPMFGCYIIALILAVLVIILGQAIAAGVQGALGGAPDTLAKLLTPAGLAVLVVTSVLQAMADVIIFAPSAAIYRDLTTTPDVDVF